MPRIFFKFAEQTKESTLEWLREVGFFVGNTEQFVANVNEATVELISPPAVLDYNGELEPIVININQFGILLLTMHPATTEDVYVWVPMTNVKGFTFLFDQPNPQL